MAKRKDDDAKKGFKIPIEDADDKPVEAEEPAPDAPAAAENAATTEDPAAAENAATTEDPAAAKSAAATGDPAAAEDAAATGDPAAAEDAAATGDPVGAQSSAPSPASADEATTQDDDLIAEAEAIVEEASAADQLGAAQAQAQDWQDRYLRLHAEWDTYRRRMGEQRAEEKARATEKLMEDLLPVLDDFERTVAYADENGETGLLDGVKAVQTKLIDALKKAGLEQIDPAGEAYDALEAQAVQMVPDDEAFDETVKDVYQKGYKMGKKVLRPAMVTVTTGGPKRPKADESEDE